ncbi:hypothetical protein AHF37_11280 [Paragonimus kellicotti]|nr:hypothetical protein AHF37_11280 [Paragonimus kellicotti]
MSAASPSELDDALLMKLESSKWQERSDVLDVLGKHILSATLPSSSHNVIVKILLQVIGSDKHTQLVTRAANMLQQFAERLGSSFNTYAERCLSVCLTKFKDNNRNVVQALRHATRAVLETMSLELGTTQVLVGMSHSSASIQAEATELLAGLTRVASTSPPKSHYRRPPLRERQNQPDSIQQPNSDKECGSSKPSKNVRTLGKSNRQVSVVSDAPVSSYDMLDHLSDYFVTVPIDQLKDADWKVRLVAAESIKSRLVSHPPSGEVLVQIVLFILKSERLQDVNLQVATSPPKSHYRRPPLRERQNQPDSIQQPNSDKECGSSKPSKNVRTLGKSNRQVSVVSDAPVSSYDMLDHLSEYVQEVSLHV